jgi:hypothetical protein
VQQEQAGDKNIVNKMVNCNSKLQAFILSFALMIIPLTALPQENSISELPVLDSALNVKLVSPHSLYASTGYGNNMVLGSTFSQDRPFYFGSLVYGYKNELFASLSTFHLAEFELFLAFQALALNYCHVFNSWFDISVGASRYQVANQLADTLFSSFFYGDLTIGIDWRLIYSKISVSGLFSETSAAYYQMRNSRYFQTPEFFRNKMFISFDPYASLLFGSMTKTTTSEGTTIGLFSPFHSNGYGRNSSGGGYSGMSKTSAIFGLMEVDLGLPVGLNIGKCTIEAEPGYVFPMYTITDTPSPKGFVFQLSFSYKFF